MCVSQNEDLLSVIWQLFVLCTQGYNIQTWKMMPPTTLKHVIATTQDQLLTLLVTSVASKFSSSSESTELSRRQLKSMSASSPTTDSDCVVMSEPEYALDVSLARECRFVGMLTLVVDGNDVVVSERSIINCSLFWSIVWTPCSSTGSCC